VYASQDLVAHWIEILTRLAADSGYIQIIRLIYESVKFGQVLF
jgi:hypothetical protein